MRAARGAGSCDARGMTDGQIVALLQGLGAKRRDRTRSSTAREVRAPPPRQRPAGEQQEEGRRLRHPQGRQRRDRLHRARLQGRHGDGRRGTTSCRRRAAPARRRIAVGDREPASPAPPPLEPRRAVRRASRDLRRRTRAGARRRVDGALQDRELLCCWRATSCCLSRRRCGRRHEAPPPARRRADGRRGPPRSPRRSPGRGPAPLLPRVRPPSERQKRPKIASGPPTAAPGRGRGPRARRAVARRVVVTSTGGARRRVDQRVAHEVRQHLAQLAVVAVDDRLARAARP